MKVLQVFESLDPELEGMHPSAVDPLLRAFQEDLAWLEASGFEVQRLDRRTQGAAFEAAPEVRQALAEDGEEVLPILLCEGRVVSRVEYPTRAELAQALGLPWHEPATAVGTLVAELVALSAAVASDCPPAFQHHLQRARRLGVSREDLLKVVNIGFSVKSVPHRGMIELAERALLPKGQGCGSGGCGCSGEEPCDPEECCSEDGCQCH